MNPLLYFLFFLSGAAGLMYESVWARYLGLFVGHEAHAQVLVLVIFLGGMSLGALLVTRRADRVRNPLRAYASIEVVVGVLALAFHPLFVTVTDWAYSHGFPALSNGAGSAFLKWGLAGLLILPQSILLGATFPLMSSAILRRCPEKPGRVLGWLYFVNSLGAALGVLVAGFLLVGLFGLPGVLYAAGTLNVVAGTGAFLLSYRFGPNPAGLAANSRIPEPAGTPPASLDRALLAAAFFTAVASFCYEIDWIRMLSLVLGSATHAFELMLSAFILGLALGAFWIRARADRLRDPLAALATIQMAMGVLAVATLPLYVASFSWMAWLHRALTASDPGYVLFTVARYAFCLAVMLPATFCAGMTLPLITRLLLARRRSEAAIGQVYAINTLGSILGAIVAALLLLPLLGLKGLLVFAGLVDIGVGALILAAAGGRRLRRFAFPLAAAGAVLIPLAVAVDRRLLVSGVYRGESLKTVGEQHLDYYADGRTATVAVTRGRDGFLALSTNGKVDASLSEGAQRRCDPKNPLRQIENDEITQLLTGVLPLGFLAGAEDAAVIGIGSGVSTHALLASPAVKAVTTIEIEPRMVDGARRFAAANRRAFHDSRSRIVIGDARTVLAGSGRRYGVIVSEPSNPWVSGVASLFTEEFYRRVAAQLTPDGIFAQWLQTYELDDGSVLRVLAALDAAFADWQVHQAGTNDILIVATPSGRLRRPNWEQVSTLPLLQADLCGVVPLGAAELEATFLADRGLLRGAAQRAGRPNSDFHPRLDLEAERRRFGGANADALLQLGDRWFNYARQLMNRPAEPTPARAMTFAGIRRSVERLTQTWQSAPATDSAPTPALARVQYEWRRWQSGLLDRQPPSDWRSWVAEFLSRARFRHAGTAGWIDEGFFQDATEFARRHQAPNIVQDLIRFRHATQGWRSAEALEYAERLGGYRVDLSEWIPIQDLLDGAVVSAVMMNRRETAKAWQERYGALAPRDSADVIAQILASLVDPAAAPPANPRK
ncbi:MAG: spermidine synthase [Gemmatimonadales bacterium]|nr:spermidine synthase [Gemmatimonadales bacterium]